MSLLGTRVGNIRVLERIGAGGMGEVYVGVDEALQRKVALKAIRGEHRLQATARARFLREARILSRLEHPNICRIYDYVEHGAAEFLVLELIDGVNLGRAIREGIDSKRKLRIAIDIAGVLAAAHAAGVVHRDLKPDNVMLTRDGQVKVLDFGLARAAAEEVETGDADTEPPPGPPAAVAAATAPAPGTIAGPTVDPGAAATVASGEAFRTAIGGMVGTPAFMSPEQARGAAVTTASDMYSFGLLLQTLYGGRLPYDTGLDAGALLAKVRAGETLPAENVGRDLAALIARLKALAPSARATAVEARERLVWIRDKPRRRARGLTAAALVVLAALAGLKYTLDLRRERAIADLRREQAEDLIGFMLGDVRAKLEPLGRLDLLEDVGDKAIAYFASVPESELSERERARRAMALYQIGDVRIKRGDLTAAMPAFEQALALGRRLIARDAGNLEWLETLALAHFWVGNGHWNAGNLAAALEQFEANLELAKRLADARPADLDLRMEVANGEGNVGSVLHAMRELGRAREHLLASKRIVEDLLSADPARDDWRFRLATTSLQLGRIRESLGELREAHEHYRADLAIMLELTARDPERPDWVEQLVVAYNHVGTALERLGQLDRSLEQHAESVRIAEGLAARDAANSWWAGILAIARRNLGWLRHLGGDAEGATSDLRSAAAALADLALRDPARRQWREEHALALLGMGSVLLGTRDTDGALAAVEQARAALEPASAEESQDPRARRILAECELLHGRVLAQRGDREAASAAWERARAAIEPVARGSSDGSLLAPLARALLRLGRDTDAEPLLAILQRQGYVDPRLGP